MPEIPYSCITTTGTIEGWTLDTYLGPVVSHVVAGAGLVTEFFAGFSDLFGGRSGSVRNRLAEIYKDASIELRREAGRRGANWILGYRIDFDEISGKNSFMFMVTASGTAVHATRANAAPDQEPVPTEVPAQLVKIAAKKRAFLSRPDRTIFDSDATWQFVIDNRVNELAPAALEWLAARYEFAAQQSLDAERSREGARTKVEAFFASLPASDASSALYNAAENPGWIRTASLDVMVSLDLMRLERSLELLQRDDFDHRWTALQTLRARQALYSVADVATVDALLRIIPTSFPPSGTSQSKGLFGTKDVWTCLCGTAQKADAAHCFSCGRDRRGFGQSDVAPESARSLLVELKEILQSAFQTTG
jgi:uncharacterized protein YbjQ (UPF0145 family)